MNDLPVNRLGTPYLILSFLMVSCGSRGERGNDPSHVGSTVDGGTAALEGGAFADAGIGRDGSLEGMGQIRFSWTIEGDTQDCLGAGITILAVNVGSRLPVAFLPCLGPNGQSGLVLQVPAGEHTFSINGRATGTTLGRVRARASGDVSVVSGRTTDVAVDLDSVGSSNSSSTEDTGEVTFEWTFDGGRSCEDVGVAEVQIAIDSRVSHFACPPGSSATIRSVGEGEPTFTATGWNDGRLIARTSGRVLVTAGEVALLPVDLRLVDATNTATLDLSWIFGRAGPGDSTTGGCARANTEALFVRVADHTIERVPCLDFDGPARRRRSIPYVTPGEEIAIGVSASATASGTGVWSSSVSTTATAGQTTAVPVVLSRGTTNTQTATGVPEFQWTFDGMDCEQASVTQTRVQAFGSAGSTVFDRVVDCTESTSYRSNVALSTGEYRYSMSATARGGTHYAVEGTFLTQRISGTVMVHADLHPVEDPTASRDPGEGSILIEPHFSDAEFGCAEGGLERVELFLTGNDDELIAETHRTVPCDELPILLPGIQGPASYYLSMRGLTASGSALYGVQIYNIAVTPDVTSTYRPAAR